jgi:hypothetical protein
LPSTHLFVEVSLPVVGNYSGRTRSGLTQRMVLGRGQLGSLARLFGLVVVEPILAGLEASDDPVASRMGMSGRVLTGGSITAADMAAFGASSEMEPPSPSL